MTYVPTPVGRLAAIVSSSLFLASIPGAPAAMAAADDTAGWIGTITYSSTRSVDQGATEPWYDATRTWSRQIRDNTSLTITLMGGTASATGSTTYRDVQDEKASAPLTFCKQGFKQTLHSEQTTTAGLNGPADVYVSDGGAGSTTYGIGFSGPTWQGGQTHVQSLSTTDDECRPLHSREPQDSTVPWGQGLDGPHAIVNGETNPDNPDVLSGSTTRTDNSGAVITISWNLHRGCDNSDQPTSDLKSRLLPQENQAKALIASLLGYAAEAQTEAAALGPGQQALAQPLLNVATTLSTMADEQHSPGEFFNWLGGDHGLRQAQALAGPGLALPVPGAINFQSTLIQLQQLLEQASAEMAADTAQQQLCAAGED